MMRKSELEKLLLQAVADALEVKMSAPVQRAKATRRLPARKDTTTRVAA